MLSKLKQTKQEGFTIIEVLIVLAIAGLILLIVFLAVPALQRSARNTSRKNDEAGVLAAISEYSDNNAGVLPTNATFSSPTITLCNAAACGGTDARSTAKLGYYTNVAASPTTGDVTIYTSYKAPPSPAADEMIIEEGSTCTSATAAAAGSSRAVAALYGIEASGAFVWQCTGS
jgi:prepilin-type N-terminal cleavage/methylation domain-containing protein